MKKYLLLNSILSTSILTACGGSESTETQEILTGEVLPIIEAPITPNEEVTVSPTTLQGSIIGLLDSTSAAVTISGNGELHSKALDAQGQYQFDDLTPGVAYSVKVQAEGYRQLSAITSQANNILAPLSVAALPNPQVDNVFQYQWQDDGQTTSGLEYSSAVNSPIKVSLLGLEHNIPNIAAAQMLYRDYRIILDNAGDMQWTQAHAYRLLETMKQIPQEHCNNQSNGAGLPCNPSQFNITDTLWQLSDTAIAGDIRIENETITLNAAAFSYADPQIVLLEGQRGRFYSKRLHHAAASYLTAGGENLAAASYILEKRYGVMIDSGEDAFHTYYDNAVIAVDRNVSAWQTFSPEEVLIIINQFEELPEGLHIIRGQEDADSGLKYLFRRANGHNHPLYPDAPAVAWTNAGYIEFMENAFSGSNLEHMQRLVIHEKTHFLWHYVLNQELKLEWLALSGWYRTANTNPINYLQDQPYSSELTAARHTHGTSFNIDNITAAVDASDGWSATNTTNFVSGYAQLKNPNEDLAESVSYFLTNPDALRSRAPTKFAFIRDRLMAGVTYLQKIRDDLTFEVLNLNPDYVYPGKIKRIDIEVQGGADENKLVTIDLELHTTIENCTLAACLEGASEGFTRIFNGTVNKDIFFVPVNEYGERQAVSNRLRASFTLPETTKSGWWAPAQIIITDPQGNQRLQRSTDYGWQMFVNNPNEDLVAPQYLAQSLTLSLSDLEYIEVSDGQKIRTVNSCEGSPAFECRAIRTLTAQWAVDEDVEMKSSNPCFARFGYENADTYSKDVYGNFTPSVQGIIDGYCSVELTTTEFYRSGQYHVANLAMLDRALNRSSNNFADDNDTLEASPKVTLADSDISADTQQPEMNIQSCSSSSNGQCLSVSATAANAEISNGETNVTIAYWARDDKAGLGTVSYILRDPQGIEHFYYHQHENSHTLFFNGDATVWKQYQATVTLPVGSAPGTWGLSSMVLHDKAGNRQFYDFTETLIFEPFEVE